MTIQGAMRWLTVLAVVGAVTLVVRERAAEAAASATQESEAASFLDELVGKLDQRAESLEASCRELAAQAAARLPGPDGAGGLTPEAYDAWLRAELLAIRASDGGWAPPDDVESSFGQEDARSIFGIGLALDRGVLGAGLYGPNLVAGEDVPRRIEDVYDYTTVEGDDARKATWFHGERAGDGVWGVYYGTSSGRRVIEFGVPIRRPTEQGGETVGVAFINWSYEQLKSLLAKEDVGGTSEVLVLDVLEQGESAVGRDARFIFSPYETWFQNDERLLDVVGAMGIDQEEARGLLRGERGETQLENRITGRRSHVVWAAMANGWLVVLSAHDDPDALAARRRGSRPLLCAAVVVALLALGAAVFLGQGEDEWDLAMVATSVFLAATAYLWGLAYDFEALSPPSAPGLGDTLAASHASGRHPTHGPLVTHSDLETRKRVYRRRAEARSEPVTFVPTGVFVQSIRFVSAHDVYVTGYLWQRLPLDLDANSVDENGARPLIVVDDDGTRLEPGVVLPESETTSFEAAYSEVKDDKLVRGWYFTATVRQPFDHTDFPFEREDVWLRLWSRSFHKNVVLVPDLEAYDPRPTSGRLGVEANLIVPGWSVRESFFTLPENSYNTNFGLDRFHGQHENPELYFNVQIQRRFVSPFISHIIPMGVILITLFILLCVSDRDGHRRFGFDSVAVIATVVGIFFVVIFQHIALRRTLEAERFVYLELFYFLTYLYLILVIVNAVVTVLDIGPARPAVARTRVGTVFFAPLALGKAGLLWGARFLNQDGNMAIRTLYWPMYTGLVWLITLAMML